MKNTILSFFKLAYCNACSSQEKFKEFTTKINNLITIIALLFISSIGYAQDEKYTVISIDSLTIGTFKYGGDIQDFIEKFGKPNNYKEYSDPYPLEGYGKSFYLSYDSLKATFVEFYGKKIISSVTITGGNYSISLEDKLLRVGNSLDALNSFKKSYDYFIQQYSENKDEKERFFYINLLIKMPHYQYYGLVNIKLRENIVLEISFRFDEGA